MSAASNATDATNQIAFADSSVANERGIARTANAGRYLNW